MGQNTAYEPLWFDPFDFTPFSAHWDRANLLATPYAAMMLPCAADAVGLHAYNQTANGEAYARPLRIGPRFAAFYYRVDIVQ